MGKYKFLVGDEVQFQGKGTKFVVTSIDEDGTLNGIGKDGVGFFDKNPDRWQKTGRYFKEAVDLMNALNDRT